MLVKRYTCNNPDFSYAIRSYDAVIYHNNEVIATIVFPVYTEGFDLKRETILRVAAVLIDAFAERETAAELLGDYDYDAYWDEHGCD